MTDDEAHAGDLAGDLTRQPCRQVARVDVAGHGGHGSDGLELREDVGVHDVAGVDDVRHAGEDLEHDGIEIAVVVADDADARDRRRRASFARPPTRARSLARRALPRPAALSAPAPFARAHALRAAAGDAPASEPELVTASLLRKRTERRRSLDPTVAP